MFAIVDKYTDLCHTSQFVCQQFLSVLFSRLNILVWYMCIHVHRLNCSWRPWIECTFIMFILYALSRDLKYIKLLGSTSIHICTVQCSSTYMNILYSNITHKIKAENKNKKRWCIIDNENIRLKIGFVELICVCD